MKFKWTEDCLKSFDELKELLVSDMFICYYDPDHPTRVFMDESPVGVASTLAQEHSIVDDNGHSGTHPILQQERFLLS